MKIGFSLSRCLREIYEGKVEENDVLVIIARTDVDPYNDDHWMQIWEGYLYGGLSNPEWAGLEDHEEGMRRLLQELYDDGKIHQPRQFKAHPPRMQYIWLETFTPYDEIANNPTVVKAWEKYKMLAGLSSTKKTVNDNF